MKTVLVFVVVLLAIDSLAAERSGQHLQVFRSTTPSSTTYRSDDRTVR